MSLLHKIISALTWRSRPVKTLLTNALTEYTDRYIQENDISPPTKERYLAFVRNINLFLATQKLQGLAISEIRIKHAEQLRTWLRANLKTCTARHASRHIELLKRTTKYAMMMEYTDSDHLSPVKSQRDKPKDIISLEQIELKKLMAYKFNGILQVAADLFIFQCFTGFSYADLKAFVLVQKESDIWLYSKRLKTGEDQYVYFFPEARAILEKYEGRLPDLPNQTFNRLLKDIAHILGIKKHLTTHVGRKTHATILDEKGVSLSTISRQLRNTVRICETSYVAKSHLRTHQEIERLGLSGGML